MGTWVRTVQSYLSWTTSSKLLASVPIGATLLRVHFGWGFQCDTTATDNFTGIAANLQVMGIVTTVGDTTEGVPNARTQSADQSPPTQRWIYWEARAPRLVSVDYDADLAIWGHTEPQALVDTKGMVSAKTVPVGSTLNVWASWSSAGTWNDPGNTQLWYWASLLYQ